MENQTPRINATVQNSTSEITATLGSNSQTLEAQAYANALILEGVSPYIGADGYWYRYDVDTRAYVNTNVKAQGERGQAGQNGSNYVITQADYEDIADMAADRITVPVATSQLLNDAGFITNAYHDSSKSDVGHTHPQYLTAHQSIKTINNQSIVGTGNITIQGGGGSTSWDDITGKPSTFTPSEHTHNQYLTEHQDISGKADVGHTHSQYLTEHQDISGKADVGHEHTVSDISDFPSIPTDTIELANTAGYITIDSVPTDSHINDLIDAKLGVIENGSY